MKNTQRMLATISTGLLLTCCLFAKSQKQTFTKQYSLTWDNDYFVFKGTDRYYTNGFFLRLNWLRPNKLSHAEKKIGSLEFGQSIYKQFTRKVWPTVLASNRYPGGVEAIDRPITGYLFAKMQMRTFFTNQTLLQWGVSVGTIGANALGRQVQNSWHKASGVGDWWNWVWDYQLKSEIGVNFHSQYAFPLFRNKQASYWHISSISNMTLGTTFTDISQSLLFQFGRFNKAVESGFWEARLSKAAIPKNELFLFYVPEIKYQVFNATIQGGLFREVKGPVISKPEALVRTHTIGLLYASSKYTFRAGVVYASKEAQSQRNNHTYGSISFASRF